MEIELLEAETTKVVHDQRSTDDLLARFEDVAARLEGLDLETLWEVATEKEKGVLLDELLDSVTVHPDRLEVAIHGAPALNVAFSEVGLKASDSEIRGVGGALDPLRTRIELG